MAGGDQPRARERPHERDHERQHRDQTLGERRRIGTARRAGRRSPPPRVRRGGVRRAAGRRSGDGRRPRRSPPPGERRRARGRRTRPHRCSTPPAPRTADEWEPRIRQEHERLEPRQRVGGTVRVDGRHRTVVTGVQRLEHVERFAAADLTDDEPVGPHPQRRPHQRPDRDTPGPLRVRRARFEPHHVRLREPQLGRLLDGDDAFRGWNRLRQRVEQGGLARARRPGHEDVPSRADGPAQERRRRAVHPEVVERDRSCAEAPDGDARTVDRQWRDDRVQARTVGKAGVDHRRRTVEPQAQRCDDPLDQVHDRVGVEFEDDGLQTARALDVGAPRTVDHDLGDRRVGEQRLERTETRDFVGELLEQLVEADARQQGLLVAQELGEAGPERDGVVGGADVVGALRDQAAVHALLERAVTAAIVRDRRPRATPLMPPHPAGRWSVDRSGPRAGARARPPPAREARAAGSAGHRHRPPERSDASPERERAPGCRAPR